MNAPLQTLLQEATRLTREGKLTEATQVIQRALHGAADHTGTGHADRSEHTGGMNDMDEGWVIDGHVFEVEEGRGHPLWTAPSAPATPPAFQPGPLLGCAQAPAAQASHQSAAASGPGEFLRGGQAKGSLRLAYKLYVPPHHAGRARPLIVMLHGCTQSPDDFAAGTGMNERARDEGFFVLYPEQSKTANPQACWNWFKPNHQVRDRGEPAAIVAAVHEVTQQYAIDERRIYIAGLSAGGAMAHIVALAYPDVFAAVGVHSGLVCGAAGNVSEALTAMKSGALARASTQGSGLLPRAAEALRVHGAVAGAGAGAGERKAAVPTIVFHGDHDQTVHPRNGEQVLEATLRQASAQGDTSSALHAASRVEQGVSRQGRPYTRSVSKDERGRVIAEHWVVHGAGHAWAGGQPGGSYTDGQGPDATGEMLRFFLAHPKG